MEVTALSNEQKSRLSEGLRSAVCQLNKMDKKKASYSIFIDEISEELGVDPDVIKLAASRMYKGDFFEKVAAQDEIESMLSITCQDRVNLL